MFVCKQQIYVGVLDWEIHMDLITHQLYTDSTASICKTHDYIENIFLIEQYLIFSPSVYFILSLRENENNDMDIPTLL